MNAFTLTVTQKHVDRMIEAIKNNSISLSTHSCPLAQCAKEHFPTEFRSANWNYLNIGDSQYHCKEAFQLTNLVYGCGDTMLNNLEEVKKLLPLILAFIKN